jgi:hypothetical protein
MYVYDVTSPNFTSQAVTVRLLAKPNLKLKKLFAQNPLTYFTLYEKFQKKTRSTLGSKCKQFQESSHVKLSALETPLLII